MPIKLRNGYEFSLIAASGARGFDGDDAGHGLLKLWKAPFKLFGMMNHTFPFITKTLTMTPRKGNLTTFRPWRAVRSIGNGNWVNAVGLTNPGLNYWASHYLNKIQNNKYEVIVSLAPTNKEEAKVMGFNLDRLREAKYSCIKAIELNLNCPNVEHTTSSLESTLSWYEDIVMGFAQNTYLPLILKLGAFDPYIEIIKRLAGSVDVVDLINAVPWDKCFGTDGFYPSPLTKYGYKGSVSGRTIKVLARVATENCRLAGKRIQVISGGGIDSYEEILYRFNTCRADAVAIGTAFIRRPWAPNKWAKKWKNNEK